MAKILDGKEVGKALKERVKESAEQYREKGVTPKLVVLRVGEEKSSVAYENAAKKVMESVSIDSDSVTLSEDSTTEDVIEAIEKLNKDDSVHGVIMMQPLPEQISRSEVSEKLDPRKDVDALNPVNMGKLVEGNEEAMAPSTPAAVMEILKYYDYDLEGVEATVIGSSPVVGKPMSIMLLNAGATVANTHGKTKDNRLHTMKSDIIVSATGALHLVDDSYIPEGATVIDVGYGYKDGKPTGDVNYDVVESIAGAITPVPGGVGSVTTAVLASQVVKAVGLLTGK
ncbi:MAG: bifunctional 5,10-methylenetetrahydrofolate dehydrogenase/5,10-methenyltetrahydrofolate cyclohydrolase [Atopococcus tabaci]|uniref:Bifunctional protein FolD n=1 Tax=Atopococcus tabaci TaxID=269774 RepID=A0AA43ZSW9_9LACT|nr:bifunctional 5,10-methylenetetrahydrofolate dehydrogenase/5,10-methenyltetrahydrofolate cyclohydrolase [Atopococcus tabaci]